MASTFVDVRHAGGSVVVSGSEFLDMPVVRVEFPGQNPVPLFPHEAVALAKELRAYAEEAARATSAASVQVGTPRPPEQVPTEARPQRLTGLDGKQYPRPGSVDRLAAVSKTHAFSHEGRSVREVQAALREIGIDRSVGTISADLTNWRCDACVQVSTERTPEQENAPAAAATADEGETQDPEGTES